MTDIKDLITDNIYIWTSAIKKRNSQGRGASKKIELTGVKKLRELILELAVRGKLVPQDVNDEPASFLLERIAEEKAQLIADKKIKKQKQLPAITDEEKPYELPLGWEWTKIQNIGHDLGQKKPDQDFTYIDVASINKELGFIEEPNIVIADNAPSRARKLVKKGTVIYSTVRPYLLNVAVINDNFSPEPIASTAFSIIHPFNGILASYVYRYLRSPVFISYVESVQTGIAYPAINDKQFFSGLIAMPPEAEQHRIIAKVDELMALCDQLEQQTEQSLTAHQTLVEELLNALFKSSDSTSATRADSASDHTAHFQESWARIAEHFDILFTTEQSIEQLKQTILQLAVMGKLVPQNPADEPASVLLEKIAAEKVQLIADKKIRKQKIQEISDDVYLYKLPEGWTWSQLGKMTASEDNAMCDGPFGSKLKTEHYINKKGFSVVRLGNIGVGKFLWGKEGHISKEHYETLPNNHMQPGDLIVAGMADPLIRTCEVPPNLGPAVNKADCFRLRIHNHLEKKYISHYLNSHVAKLFASEENQGMTRQRINLGNCKAIPIPIPPIYEQEKIVAKVDELMALCDQLKTRLNDAQTTQLHLADAVVSNALNVQALTEKTIC